MATIGDLGNVREVDTLTRLTAFRTLAFQSSYEMHVPPERIELKKFLVEAFVRNLGPWAPAGAPDREVPKDVEGSRWALAIGLVLLKGQGKALEAWGSWTRAVDNGLLPSEMGPDSPLLIQTINSSIARESVFMTFGFSRPVPVSLTSS